MMHILRSCVLIAPLFFRSLSARSVEHEYVEDGIEKEITFGQKGAPVWTKDHREITGWSLHGRDFIPELYSDRVILTPPYAGNKRGAIWAEHPETHAEWEAEFQFRVNGPDRGQGNLQFWYVRNPQSDVEVDNIYAVGKFDGVAVVISQHGGTGGSIRAFLNDGTVSYKAHSAIDQLSFAQCDFRYRNLGVFSKITIKQTYWNFIVEVDGRECIKQYTIHLPDGYHFGLTAASSDPPDSFEVKSFIVHKLKEGQKVVEQKGGSAAPAPRKFEDNMRQWKDDAYEWLHRGAQAAQAAKEKIDATRVGGVSKSNDAGNSQGFTPADIRGWMWTSEAQKMKDRDAAQIKSEADRFKDLHDRVSTIYSQLDMLYYDLSLMKKDMDAQYNEIIELLRKTTSTGEGSRHSIEAIEEEIHDIKHEVGGSKHSLHGIEDEMHEIKQDVASPELKDLIRQLHLALNQGQNDLQAVITGSSPRLNFFAFMIVASNIVMLGSYLLYRRRKEWQPKKYL